MERDPGGAQKWTTSKHPEVADGAVNFGGRIRMRGRKRLVSDSLHGAGGRLVRRKGSLLHKMKEVI